MALADGANREGQGLLSDRGVEDLGTVLLAPLNEVDRVLVSLMLLDLLDVHELSGKPEVTLYTLNLAVRA